MDTTGKFLYYGKLSSFKDCAGPDKMIAYEVEGNSGFLDKTGMNNIPLKYSGWTYALLMGGQSEKTVGWSILTVRAVF